MATNATTQCEFFTGIRSEKPNAFLVAPLNLKDVEAINLTIRGKLLKAARQALEDETNPIIVREMFDSAMRTAAGLSMLNDAGMQHLRTIEGAALILWHSLVKNAPQLTLDEVADMIKDDRNAFEYEFAYAIINDCGIAVRKPKKVEALQDAANPTLDGEAKTPQQSAT